MCERFTPWVYVIALLDIEHEGQVSLDLEDA